MLFTHKSALDLPTAPGTFKNLAGTLALSNGTIRLMLSLAFLCRDGSVTVCPTPNYVM